MKSLPDRRLIWRVLRRWLPGGFRERRAEAVLETHVALAGGPERARGAVFWIGVARDVVATGIQLRLDGIGGRVGDGTARPDAKRGRRSGAMSGWEALRQSVFMAARSLRRTPLFAAAVVLILALGISSNVTMFRVLDRLLLSPPEQIRSPDEVKRIYLYGHSPFSGDVTHSASLSYPDYRGLAGVASFDGVAGYGTRSLTLWVDGAGETVSAEFATASYFDVLGVRAAAGRFYSAEEDAIGSPVPTAVLGWSYWQRRFSGDRGVIGRELEIGRTTYTVVGVAPRGFTGVGISPIDVWLPIHVASAAENGSTAWVDAHGWLMMAAVARVSGPEPRAVEEATVVARGVREAGRRADPDLRVVLSPLIHALGPNPSRESQVARMLAVLTVLVLLITCANVGNLYLARVLARRRELAVQTALGVSRGQLFAQLLAEVAIVALAAGAFAWWLGTAAAGALFGVLLPDAALPTANGPRVLVLTVVLALITALLTGVLPALRATRVSVMDAMGRGTATRRTLLVRRVLLAFQAALSVLLLVGAGLFIRSLVRAESIDFGLDVSALTLDIEIEGGITFGEGLSDEVLRLLPIVRQSALVENAAATSVAPFSGWWGVGVSSPDGEELEMGASGPFLFGVTGDYFVALGLPILQGRPLTDDDTRPGASPVAVVNERLAGLLWPGRDAIGRCLVNEREQAAPVCTTVVGVARDYRPSITGDDSPGIYYVSPTHPALGSTAANTIIVRAREGVAPITIRDFVRSAAPHLRMVTVAPLSDRFAAGLRAWRMGAALLTATGILALIIAAAGLYSMLAFEVLQRRRELGIRAALGASSSRLVRSTIAASSTAVLAGVLLGLVGSLASGSAIESLLFRVSANDPAVYAGVCAVLLGVGVLAGALPARNVTRTDPAISLREE